MTAAVAALHPTPTAAADSSSSRALLVGAVGPAPRSSLFFPRCVAWQTRRSAATINNFIQEQKSNKQAIASLVKLNHLIVREAFGWASSLLQRRRGRRRRRAAAAHPKKMARPPILSVALPSDTGRVLSIQSHTVQGYVGNKSAVFPLQLLGFDVDPINSVQFSNHTGYPTFRGQVLNGTQLWDLIEGLEENDLLHYTHLLTGYIGSVSFLDTVLQVIDKLRSVNPDLVYVCDPVLGDEGKLYVPQELISVYQQKVVPVASMLTPNQFEVELLTGLRITSEQDGLTACNTLHSAGPRKVVITSALIGGKLLLIGSHKKSKEQPPEQFKIEIPKIPAYFTGTGDLTTALLLGWSNKYPDNLETAAELAVSSLQALLKRTVEDYKRAGFDPSTSSLEIRLIQSQDDIRNPAVTCKAVKYDSN
ncbi:Pyridoxal kinase [Dichanthelium oligosanthes]|uniref:pyridoxal kinase n=1 Tax=Dichanthelium oligosanthes TaxID=888268 RepID=A0A1E5W1P7_9POAL|nr:Pyridoxal kinase [Dichanthelium oligosanthes]